MSVLSASYGIVDARKVEPSRPKLVKLPRPVTQELVLLSVLCPLSFCDLSAPVSTRGYATEMRLNIRVVMCLPIWAWTWLGYSGGLLRSEAVASGLLKRLRWQGLKILSLLSFALRRVLVFRSLNGLQPSSLSSSRYAGARVALLRLGQPWRRTGLVIDLSDSPAFNLEWIRVIEWLIHLLQARKVRSFMVEPPCITFSSAAYPALRSYGQPRGYRPLERRNSGHLAVRSLTLMFVLLCHVIGFLEQPRLGKMAWLNERRRLPVSFGQLPVPLEASTRRN